MSADLKSEGSGSAVYCLQDELIEDGDEDDYRYEEVLDKQQHQCQLVTVAAPILLGGGGGPYLVR